MRYITYLIFTFILLISCSGTTNKVNAQQEQQGSVIIHRLDKVLYEGLIQNPLNVREMSRKTSSFKPLISALGHITIENTPDTSAAVFWEDLQKYYSNPTLQKMYQDALTIFSDVERYEAQLTSAGQIISEEFEGKRLPELYMHVSGFRENVIILDNVISISIDKYLGSDYTLYQNFFQPFERQQMTPKFVVRDYLKAWLMSEIIKPDADNQDMVSAMIYEGKILYTLSKLLPDMKMEDIIGYTTKQMSWSKENEKSIWRWLVKDNRLFTTDHMMITRFINDAPSTAEISKESPGRLGAWVGWQIVQQYATKKGFLLNDVLNMDSRTILEGAKYNP